MRAAPAPPTPVVIGFTRSTSTNPSAAGSGPEKPVPASSCHGARPQQSAAEKLLPRHLVWVQHGQSLALALGAWDGDWEIKNTSAKRCEIGIQDCGDVLSAVREYGGVLVTIYIRLTLSFCFLYQLDCKSMHAKRNEESTTTSIPAATDVFCQ